MTGEGGNQLERLMSASSSQQSYPGFRGGRDIQVSDNRILAKRGAQRKPVFRAITDNGSRRRRPLP